MTKRTWLAIVFGLSMCTGAAWSQPTLTRINLEISQPVLPAATAFEFIFDADQSATVIGGVLPGSNPFVSAQGMASNSVTFDSKTDSTILRLAGDQVVPLGDPNNVHHVGYQFTGTYRAILDLGWRGGGAEFIAVGDVACFFAFDSAGGSTSVVAQNRGTRTVSLRFPAFDVIQDMPSLEDLTPSNFPLESMTPAPVLISDLLPGESSEALVVPMNSNEILVTRALITFSGDSSNEPYALAGGTNLSLWAFSPAICTCDWNRDSVINSQDFFDFLVSFFIGWADFNMDAVTNSQDFFDFLVCFFAGCA